MLKKITAASLAGSSGSQSNAPTAASEARGSKQSDVRSQSKFSRKRAKRSAKLPPPRSGAPETTSRVGSPAVWESMTRIFSIRVSIAIWIEQRHIVFHRRTRDEIRDHLPAHRREAETEH